VRLAYERMGAKLCHHRWRDAAGEIDLILRHETHLFFVEVKAAQTHDHAARRISAAQAMRSVTAAQSYVEQHPEFAHLNPRYDAALVDRVGRVEILQNALGDFIL